MQLVYRLDKALAKAEEITLALLLVTMVVLAAVQVLLRNIWDTAIDWADISLQHVTLIVGLVGAAIATSEGRHLNIDLLSRVLHGRGKQLLRLVIGCFAVAVCSLMARGGYTTYQANLGPWLANVPENWSAAQLLRQQLAEGTFPQWLSQLPLLGGFALIGFHFFLRLMLDVGTLITGRNYGDSDEQGLEGDALLDQMVARASEEANDTRDEEQR